MQSQSFSKLTPEQQEKVLDNVVNAVQILHASVKARKEKEFIEQIKNGKVKHGKFKRIQN